MIALWNFIVGWGGLGLLIAAVAALVSYLFPLVRRVAFEVAGLALAATFIWGNGYATGLDVKQKEWDDAKTAAIERSEGARSDAVRDIGDGGSRPDELSNDKFNRD